MECTICFETVDAEKGRKLSCNHLFHCTCISKWLDVAATCPVCRKTVADDTPMSVVISRFMRVLSEYVAATDNGEKEYKRDIMFRMIGRYNLEYDVRIANALSVHGINIE